MCKCGSDEIVSVDGKCSDCCFVSYKEYNQDGYVPYKIGIGGGDYIRFSYCANCGQIQGKFPVDVSNILVLEKAEEC